MEREVMAKVNIFSIEWSSFLKINEESKALGYKKTFCPVKTGMEYCLAHSAPWRIGKTDVERHTLAWDSQYFSPIGVNFWNWHSPVGKEGLAVRMTAHVTNPNYQEGDNIVFEWDCHVKTFLLNICPTEVGLNGVNYAIERKLDEAKEAA